MDLEAQMGSSALRYTGAAGRYGRSPLLKLQSDERLVTMLRKGNQGAFEVLVARYNSRLLSFCRHMLGSREDAEDVLQDVLTASYNAMLADDRPINVRPWLYRIARNRCLNHLRRNRAVGVDSMDIHFAEHGATTADKVHEREEFRQLLHDIRDLPETQRTALVLREMDALSYEQIAEAMETTVSSVKSLLVRARVSLTEAAEARLLTCDEVREELAEIAEGMRRKQSASVRRHIKNCSRCEVFQGEMKKSSRALAALAPIGPFALLHKLLFAHAASHSAGSAGVAGAAGAGGAGAAGAAGAAAGGGSAGLLTAGVGAVATKAAAGIAAAALVTAGTVAIDHNGHRHPAGPSASTLVHRSLSAGLEEALGGNSHLGRSVGAGPGLNTAVISGKVSKSVRKDIKHNLLTIGSTLSKGRAPKHSSTTSNGPAHNTHSTVPTQSTHGLTPPPNPATPATNDAVVNTSGGNGLGTPGSPATNSTASATLSTSSTNSTPFDTSTTGTTSTTGSTVTSTTGTTATTTTTSPVDTTTAPVDTTTTPVTTTTTPADTTTGAATTPTQSSTVPTSGS